MLTINVVPVTNLISFDLSSVQVLFDIVKFVISIIIIKTESLTTAPHEHSERWLHM